MIRKMLDHRPSLRFMYAIALISAFALPLAAQKANVTYMEGTAKIKSGAGSMRLADFGSTVTYGESVITGKDGLVEMVLPNGSTIRVSEDSVFTYSETGTGSDSRPVLATLAGSVSYKLNKSVGRSPLIQTNSMVAGVRGTEFTVFAGRDGSVLLAVTEGIVDVSAQGETVELLKDEAAQVAPGEKPGEKYIWLGKELDFSSWNQGQNANFLADPVAGIERVAVQLDEYTKELAALKVPYAKATAAWEAATDEYKTILAKGDEAAIKAYQTERLFPAQDARATLILDMRYWALNYLSLRRYGLSNMYMEIKSRSMLKSTTESKMFFMRHAEILHKYEAGIVPDLTESDY